MRTSHRKASKAKRQFKADPSSIYKVMGRVQPFTTPERDELLNPVKAAFERMKTGKAEREDFDTLGAMSNICLIRSEDIDPLCVVATQRCQDALMRCLRRFESTGRWGFDGLGIQDVEIVIDFYAQLIELSTPQQMKEAMLIVLDRTKQGEVLQ